MLKLQRVSCIAALLIHQPAIVPLKGLIILPLDPSFLPPINTLDWLLKTESCWPGKITRKNMQLWTEQQRPLHLKRKMFRTKKGWLHMQCREKLFCFCGEMSAHPKCKYQHIERQCDLTSSSKPTRKGQLKCSHLTLCTEYLLWKALISVHRISKLVQAKFSFVLSSDLTKLRNVFSTLSETFAHF